MWISLLRKIARRIRRMRYVFFLLGIYLDWWTDLFWLRDSSRRRNWLRRRRQKRREFPSLALLSRKRWVVISIYYINQDPQLTMIHPRRWTATENAPPENSRAGVLANECAAAFRL